MWKRRGVDIPYVDVGVDTTTPEAMLKGIRAVVKLVWPEYWQLPDEAFAFKRFTDGLSNILFRVTIASHAVLCRIYGENTDIMLDRDAEIRRQLRLSHKGLAAQFYAKFRNGCCYEYLEGTPLDATTVVLHASDVAHEVAKWHRTVVEDPSVSAADESSSVALIRKWLGLLPPDIPAWQRSHYSPPLLAGELAQLLARLVPSPTRLCHNDVLPFNILLHGGRVRFIDYEYSGFGARGFDLGNHFNEYAGFDLDLKRYPTPAQQRSFVTAYLRAFYQVSEVSEAEVTSVVREANQWSLVSHFLWAVWGIFQANHSSIDFDFMRYSNERFAIYFRNRDRFLAADTTEYVYQ